MNDGVIYIGKPPRLVRLHPPLPPKQELTLELAWELMHAPGVVNMIHYFAEEYPDEFYAAVAKHFPELFAKWVVAAMREDPSLRRKVLREMHRDGVEYSPLASRKVWRAWR